MSTPGELGTYVFPQRWLKRSLNDPKKSPLILVACGQLSLPIHTLFCELTAQQVLSTQ